VNGEPLKRFIELLGIKGGEPGVGYLTVSCPLAQFRHSRGTDRNPSFGFSTEADHVHCFSCGFSGSYFDLLLELWYYGVEGIDYAGARHLLSAPEAKDPELFDPSLGSYEEHWKGRQTRETLLFPEEWLASFPRVNTHWYLEQRKTPSYVAEFLDLRFDWTRQRICFPVRDFQGRLRGLHGRSVTGKEPKYRMYPYKDGTNPQIWLGEHWINLDEPLVVVESVFDLARVLEVTKQVICPLSATFSKEKAERLNGAAEIHVCFDNDEAGTRARRNLINWTKGVQVFGVVHLPAGKKDPGELDAEELRELLRERVAINE